MKEAPLSLYTAALQQSGAGVPHSTTLPRIIMAPGKFREVLECGTPVPLSALATYPEPADRTC